MRSSFSLSFLSDVDKVDAHTPYAIMRKHLFIARVAPAIGSAYLVVHPTHTSPTATSERRGDGRDVFACGARVDLSMLADSAVPRQPSPALPVFLANTARSAASISMLGHVLPW